MRLWDCVIVVIVQLRDCVVLLEKCCGYDLRLCFLVIVLESDVVVTICDCVVFVIVLERDVVVTICDCDCKFVLFVVIIMLTVDLVIAMTIYDEMAAHHRTGTGVSFFFLKF